ncbi:unnamed protein product [Mytilus coruscus]|uniref:Uncharacterized protein n=1 Tax=Mytilus coruscus TaxID=42192 RepID=A0A6J8DWM9_MYTCO|nr:unnamed protein product [Mytilus coruscus]
MKNIISELKTSIDNLECMAEEKIENVTEETKMFIFRNSTKGKPFTDRLRQVYYCFRSRKIGLEHIAPLIISVLSLADITLTLDDLPNFMPTGKYYAPNDEILNICKSCPSNNISVERLMAKMDNCIVNAPTYNTNSMESVIMFKNNNTQEWLHKKTDAETTEIIANAAT